MDCKTFEALLDLSPEERTEEQKQLMTAHAQQCKKCEALYVLAQDAEALDAKEEVPEKFTLGWRKLIREEEKMEKKQTKRSFNWQRMLATAAAVVLVFGGATVSYLNEWGVHTAGKNENGSASYSMRGTKANYMLSSNSAYDTAADGMVMMAAKGVSTQASAVQEAKIIRTVNYTIKTRAYDADFEALKAMVEEHNGYVESLSISGDVSGGETRYAHFTLRIPAQQLDAFLGSAKNVGTTTSYSEYTEDVSETYYDIAARLETQQSKLVRLNELLAKAEDMSDLIEIESAISDTQYQIDRYTGQLKGYDSRVNDSYVYVTLQEMRPNDVAESSDVTLLERIANAVKVSLEGLYNFAQAMVVFVVAALPWCGVLAVIVIAVKIVRCIKKKKA